MDYIKNLQDMGLKKQEADTYLACLRLGVAKISDLAREVEIPRTSIYVYAKNLLEKGFLKKSKKGKVEYFTPVDPRDIFENTKEKIDSFGAILPQLEKILDFAGKKPKIEFYDTKRGLLELYEKTLRLSFKHIPYLIESGEATKSGVEKVGLEYMNKWQKKFLEKGVVTQGMITKDTIPVIQSMPEKTKEIMRKRSATVRVIDEKLFPFSINLYLFYPNNAFIVVPQQNFVLMVEDKNIYNSLLTLYKLLYEQAQPIDIKAILQ